MSKEYIISPKVENGLKLKAIRMQIFLKILDVQKMQDHLKEFCDHLLNQKLKFQKLNLNLFQRFCTKNL